MFYKDVRQRMTATTAHARSFDGGVPNGRQAGHSEGTVGPAVVAALCAVISLVALPARAQQGPIGDHYAARASDAMTSPTGGYNQSVRVSAPPARGGVPIPFQLRYDAGNKVGEGGLGWHVPASYVLRADSFTRHRPRFASDSSGPKPLPRLWLVMDDVVMQMSPIDRTDTRFRPMVDSQTMLLTREGEAWTLKDGTGYVYQFRRIAGLEDETLWILTEINDSTGLNPVRLDYSVAVVQASGGENRIVRELRLDAIRYNFLRPNECAKHEIRLAYQSFPTATPKVLQYIMQNGHVRARTQVIDRIDVLARADECSPAGTTENTAPARAAEGPLWASPSQVRLRRYKLRYSHDQDILQPRLSSIDLYGQEGTAEAATAIPVARYNYGRAKNRGGIRYFETNTISMPSALAGLDPAISSMVESPVSPYTYATRHMLLDFNGDKRADLMYPKGGFEQHNVWISRNAPPSTIDISGLPKSDFLTSKPLFGVDPTDLPLGLQVTTERRYQYGEQMNTEDTMVQAIDFNGDGRIDILDARDAGHWWLLLNVPPAGGDPTGIGWKVMQIDTEPIRKALMDHGQWDITAPWPLPLQRSRTGREIDFRYCWDYIGNLDNLNNDEGADDPGSWDKYWKPCEDENIELTSGDQHTRTEWMLSDVNGDGWIDLVVNSVPIGRQILSDSADDCRAEAANTPKIPIPPALYFSRRVHCSVRSRIDFIRAGNKLQAHYNMAGAQLRTGVRPFAPRVILETADCAVEEWWAPVKKVSYFVQDAAGNPIPAPPPTIGPWRYLECGLIDVSGDGIPDRIRKGKAYLGTGELYTTSLDLPGAASAVYNHRDEVCGPNPKAEYTVSRTVGFIDITGDGIADYVSGNRVRLGTGTGWTEEVPVNVGANAGSISFLLSKSIETCEGAVSRTVAGLYDMDGDGRPDFIEATGTKLRTFQLLGGSIPASANMVGAHDAGRLTSVENGFGAKTMIEYASAKNDFHTLHRVPFPEIVVAKVTTASRDGAMEPVRFAYGDAELRFDPAADRWTFPGYGRTIVLRGQPYVTQTTGRPQVVGTASITDRVRPKDYPSGFESVALVGRIKNVHLLDGILPGNAWTLLPMVVTTAPQRHGQVGWDYKTYSRSLQTGGGGDCTNMGSPYTLGPVYFVDPDFGLDWPCLATGFAYANSTTQWRGAAAPPSTKNVVTRRRTLSVDQLGRPLLVAHDNDLFYSADDVCEKISYATSVGEHHIANAVHTWRLFHSPSSGPVGPIVSPQSCKEDDSRPLAGVRYAYDYQTDVTADGEAHVTRGFRTQEFAQRYNVSSGALIDELERYGIVYDIHGNVTQVFSARDEGVEPQATTYTYDPFKLVVVASSTYSGGSTTVLNTSNKVDAVTLLTMAVTTPNGAAWRRTYDGFGRTVLQSVLDPAEGKEYVLGLDEYMGDSGTDPGGRRIRTEVFRSKVTLSAYLADPSTPGADRAGATVFVDDLGRERRTVLPLGTNYAGQVLVLNDATFDSLGRPSFVSDPYLEGGSSVPYGTTYLYRPDNSVHCAVTGRGPQSSTTTLEAKARFPTCTDVVYQNHRRETRIWGPNERLADSTHAELYSQATTTAVGWPLAVSRRSAAGVALELMEYDYDRLGNAIALRRFQEPATRGGELVWRMQYDSTGQAVQISEPEASTLTRRFDHWGNLIETKWLDAGVARELRSEYDVFGRLSRTVEERDGAPDPATEVRYAYDIPSGDENHLNSDYLLGRLSHASSASMRIFYGYDGLGRTRTVTRVGSDGERYAEIYDYFIDGALSRLSYRHPGAGDLEAASYRYDSARRATSVIWRDESGSQEVFRALDIDPFGRYLRVQYGNGVREIREFNNTDRREPTKVELRTANGVFSRTFNQYDADLRVLEVREQTPLKNERTFFDFDPVYRLARSKTLRPSGAAVRHETFSYDGLGNLRTLVDHLGIGDLTITPRTGDRDQICNVTRGRIVIGVPAEPGQTSFLTTRQPSGSPAPTGDPLVQTPESCEYGYDALGNVVRISENDRAPRAFTYDGYSRIVRLSQSGATAEYKYGPFGEVSELDITGAPAGQNRRDRRYGPLMEQSLFMAPGAVGVTSAIERRVVGPMGVFMARRGNQFLYWHGDDRGNRLFTDGAGAVVQEVDYRSYGHVTTNTAAIGDGTHTKYLFNGGDALSAFGVTQLGARVYDPTTARYLQRDPILASQTASKTHPYAFAWSDPFTYSDPSGLNPDCIQKEGLHSECGSEPLAEAAVAVGVYFIKWAWQSGGGEREPQSAPLPVPDPIAEYHGVGGWVHQNVLDPLASDYAEWRRSDLTSEWGDEVWGLGHLAGAAADIVIIRPLGVLGGGVTEGLQLIIPKSEEDAFMFVASAGMGEVISSGVAGIRGLVSRLGSRLGGARTVSSVIRAEPDVYVWELFTRPIKGPRLGSTYRGYDPRSPNMTSLMAQAQRLGGPQEGHFAHVHSHSTLAPGERGLVRWQSASRNLSASAGEKARVRIFRRLSEALGWDPHDPNNPFFTRPSR